jgi:protein TonB
VRAPGEYKALPVMDVAPLVDTTYYTARELDVLPQPTHPVMPNFPERAKLAGLTGWVVLTLKIDDTGAVQSAMMKDANPPDVFDQSTLAAFRHAHFSPGIKAGRPVYSELEIKVHFGDQ